MKKRHLLKTMLLLFALIVGSSSVWADDVTDVITASDLAATSTAYTDFSGVSITSDAVYAGQSAKDGSGNIQMRSKNSNSGIVSTTSGGKLKSVKITVGSGSNTIDVYGSNIAYNSAADLYATGSGANQGTKIGSVSSTGTITVSGDYAYVGIRSNSGAIYLSSIEITWETSSGSQTATATSVTIDASGITNTNVYEGTAAGSLTATVKAGDAAIDGATVTWTSSNESVATIDANGAVTLVAAGTTTITASYAGVEGEYKSSSATYELTVTNSDPNQPGSENKPYTVAEARAAIDANSGVTGVYATGIVSEIVTTYNSQYGNISYNISADGLTTSDQLQAYRGKSYNGDNFTSEDDIQVGDIVVVYGNLKKYNSTYEFDANNQLVSLKRAGVATLEFDQESYTVGVGGELTITATSSDSDGAITYSSSNTDVADIDATTGVVTAKAEGTTTITATIAATDELKGTTATVELTVTDSRVDADLAWSEEEVNIELNATEYTLPTLTNPNSLTVTYSSSNENVAIVVEGEVLVETSAAGTATITATFAGNNEFKSGSASYTINIIDPNQKGAKLNPYTVAEVIDGTATGNDIYVLGYIVGEFVGKTTNPRTSSFTTDANIALADEFTTSPTAAASIPVQLSTDVLKSTWGNKTTGGTMGYQVLIKGNKDTYFTVNGIKNTVEVVAIQKVVSISDAKYATFSSAYPFDFSESGITVYTAKANGTSVSLTKVEDGIVPAKTGVVLFSESVVTNKNVPITTTTKTTLENNEMVANVVRAKVYLTEGDKTNYILSNEDAGVGFYKAAANGAYLPANRAYLSTTATATGNAPFLGFDGNETTGINSVERGALSVEGCYTLDGRRVAQPTKGLYIVNGRKVIIK